MLGGSKHVEGQQSIQREGGKDFSFFLGYALNSKAYRFSNLGTNPIFEAIDAEFFNV